MGDGGGKTSNNELLKKLTMCKLVMWWQTSSIQGY